MSDVTFPTTGWQKLHSSPELCAPVTVQTVVQYFLDSVAADDMPTTPWRGRTASCTASSSVDLSKKLKSLVWTITSSSEQGASQRCGRVPLTSWGWQWMSWRRRTSQLLSSGLQSVCLALQERHRLHPANTSLRSCMLSRRWPSSDEPCL